MEPACDCTMCQSCCYSCLFKWTVLHAFEMGRVDPGRGGPIIEHLPNRPPTLSPEGDTSQYGPRDAVLLDGNFMHAITRLRGLPEASTPQLSLSALTHRPSYLTDGSANRPSPSTGHTMVSGSRHGSKRSRGSPDTNRSLCRTNVSLNTKGGSFDMCFDKTAS